MTGQPGETLTAALRRLAEEGASGLLGIETSRGEVLLRLRDGQPVALGPRPDVWDRVGRGAAGPLASAAAVDLLLGTVVDAVVAGQGRWSWDVPSDEPLVAVPAGLTRELQRRAVDAAEALASLPADTTVLPADGEELTGELATLHALLGTGRTVGALAEEAGLPLSTTAVLVRAMAADGVVATEAPRAGSAAAAAPAEPDEPEAEPLEPAPEPLEPEAEPLDEPAATVAPVDSLAEGADATVDDEGHEDDELEPELWVMTPEPDDAPGEPDEPAVPAAPPADAGTGGWSDAPPSLPPPEPAPASASELVGDDWADTTWLDELEDPAPRRRDVPVADTPARTAPDDDEPASEPPPARPTPRADPSDVSEFLRELSRLALEDD